MFQDVVCNELLNDFQKPKAIPEELGQEEKGLQLPGIIIFLPLTILGNRDTTAVKARNELQEVRGVAVSEQTV
jgi:hypothetical protein